MNVSVFSINTDDDVHLTQHQENGIFIKNEEQVSEEKDVEEDPEAEAEQDEEEEAEEDSEDVRYICAILRLLCLTHL